MINHKDLTEYCGLHKVTHISDIVDWEEYDIISELLDDIIKNYRVWTCYRGYPEYTDNIYLEHKSTKENTLGFWISKTDINDFYFDHIKNNNFRIE